MIFNIPSEILIPAVSAVVLAFIAHVVTVLMQSKSNKHDFSIKTFESVSTDLDRRNKQLDDERKSGQELARANVDLRGEKYLLEARLEVLNGQLESSNKKVEELLGEKARLEERAFQLSVEVSSLKKRVQILEDKVKELTS